MRNALWLAAAGALALTLVLVAAEHTNGQEVGEVYRRVHTSVAVIKTKKVEASAARGSRRMVTKGATGSGVLISRDGKVMTAAHVVHTAKKVTVSFFGGFESEAHVVGSDQQTDLALLQLEKLPPKSVAVAPLGDSNRSRVGDRVFIIGAPRGISHTLTVGVVSARRRRAKTAWGKAGETLQTDAAINPGNSGGPMFNMKGEVIGIVSYIVSRSGGSEGLGFVMTSNLARQLLLEQDPFWSGTQHVHVTGALADALNVPGAGLLIERVAADAPFATAFGLKAGTVRGTIDGTSLILGGDVVVEIAGVRIAAKDSYDEVGRRVLALKKDDELSMKLLRDGRLVERRARLSPTKDDPWRFVPVGR